MPIYALLAPRGAKRGPEQAHRARGPCNLVK